MDWSSNTVIAITFREYVTLTTGARIPVLSSWLGAFACGCCALCTPTLASIARTASRAKGQSAPPVRLAGSTVYWSLVGVDPLYLSMQEVNNCFRVRVHNLRALRLPA